MANYPIILWSVALAVLIFPILRIVYNLTFHPLAKIPGPRSWAATRFPFIRGLVTGRIIYDFQKIHARYGPIIRVAPNEVTLANPNAWDIFQPRKNRAYFPKYPLWWSPPGISDSITATVNPEKHARMRRQLSPSFTSRALREQEPFVHKYVNLLVDRLSDLAKAGEDSTTEVNMTPWFNFTTFDVFADLGFGESFDCLQHSKYHPWIELTFNTVKHAAYVQATRFYPAVEFILHKLIPESSKKMRRHYIQHVADRVQRRLGYELQRPDFVSTMIGKDGGILLPFEEITSNFLTLAVAGSETTATTLTGTIGYLVNEPEILGNLEKEIRETFMSLADITIDAVQNLPYLNGVLHEGLRLCTPVPWVGGRFVPEGGETVCGYWLPGGTLISVQSYTINRDPNLFHNSTTFVPERWLPEAISNPKSPFYNDKRDAVQPFSVGTHACLGIQLAWAELRTILAKLVWSFDFTAIEGERFCWEDRRIFFLFEREPVNVRIKLRKEVI
ncbi:cytochrome P450 [Aspergillus crustosus]